MRKPHNELKIKSFIRRLLLTNRFTIYKTINGQFLTRDAARILVCCIYDIDDMYFYGHEMRTHFIDAYLGKSMTPREIFSALQYLEQLGLIENLHGTPNDYRFNPTHEGMHFFELRWKNTVYWFVNSIFIPVIASIITTILLIAFNLS